MALAAKPPSASLVEMTELVMPPDANAFGTAFGGRIVQWTDLAGGVCAMRHAGVPVVTVAIDQLTFLAPIRIGYVALLEARVNAAFRSSMEVGVEVVAENPLTGERHKCCDAYLSFVAIGPDKRPTEVPPLLVESEEERRRERDAHTRRDARLALRAALCT
ncbi:MAG TPA: acyl-CoA thioesterase [Anaeromyxobacteraceae bacterium]|nr:acyl-CoA thioesterase [Anaeromyxobacteraceae bacterium]